MADIPGSQEELGKIGELADFSRIEGKAHIQLEKSVGSQHRLSDFSDYDFSDYTGEIEYLSDDMDMETGLLRILEKVFVRYNFDSSAAYFKIREDAERSYDS